MKKTIFVPNYAEFVKTDYWAINEAAYMLTKWPTHGVALCTLSPPPHGSTREHYYLPVESVEGGEAASTILQVLQKEIVNGHLQALQSHISTDINWLVRPMDVIFWALRRDSVLPEKLQEAIGIAQQEGEEFQDREKRAIRLKIAAQWILCENGQLERSKLPAHISNSGLLHRLLNADKTPRQILDDRLKRKPVICDKTISRDIESVFDKPGQRGRKSSTSIKHDYIPVAIDKVVFGPRENRRYRPSALKLAIHTIALAEESSLFFSGLRISKHEFTNKVIHSKVAQLYLKEAPEIIVRLAVEACEQVWMDLESFWTMVDLDNHFKVPVSCKKTFLQKKTRKCPKFQKRPRNEIMSREKPPPSQYREKQRRKTSKGKEKYDK